MTTSSSRARVELKFIHQRDGIIYSARERKKKHWKRKKKNQNEQNMTAGRQTTEVVLFLFLNLIFAIFVCRHVKLRVEIYLIFVSFYAVMVTTHFCSHSNT